MRNFIGVLSVCSLTACGSLSNSPSYSTDLQKWIGRSEAQLYSSWGTPEDEFYVTPDKKVVVYIQTYANGNPYHYSDELYYQGMGEDRGLWDDMFGPPAEKQANDYYCKTSFVIQDSMIVDYNFNGDYCGE
ncbi:MAG: hypothetical protein E7004_00365 [Alphaproteobacteria bacterium]|jgi:hypothetical protein|nr:hypothetical protein [Alphaproteobacteria bacterium]